MFQILFVVYIYMYYMYYFKECINVNQAVHRTCRIYTLYVLYCITILYLDGESQFEVYCIMYYVCTLWTKGRTLYGFGQNKQQQKRFRDNVPRKHLPKNSIFHVV